MFSFRFKFEKPAVVLNGIKEVTDYFEYFTTKVLINSIPYGYTVEKVIINNRTVIAYVKDEKNNITCKGVAKCHYEDEFVESKGVLIALAKAVHFCGIAQVECEMQRAIQESKKNLAEIIRQIERL